MMKATKKYVLLALAVGLLPLPRAEAQDAAADSLFKKGGSQGGIFEGMDVGGTRRKPPRSSGYGSSDSFAIDPSGQTYLKASGHTNGQVKSSAQQIMVPEFTQGEATLPVTIPATAVAPAKPPEQPADQAAAPAGSGSTEQQAAVQNQAPAQPAPEEQNDTSSGPSGSLPGNALSPDYYDRLIRQVKDQSREAVEERSPSPARLRQKRNVITPDNKF